MCSRRFQGWLPAVFLLLTASVLRAETGAGLEFGGRIKLDAVYNDNPVGRGHTAKADLAFSPGSIPAMDIPRETGEWNLRESRLWGLLHLPLAGKDLAVYSEIDFFDTRKDTRGGTRLSNIPRLRHAYASYGPVTLGMTYTTFVNQSAYPEINDGHGPVGTLSIRQYLVRYQHEFGWGHLQVAMEEPRSTLTDPDSGSQHKENNSVPDLVAKLTWEDLRGSLSIAAMARRIGLDSDGPAPVTNVIWGGAVSVAGNWYTSGRDNLRFSLSWGNALGRYVSFGTFTDGVFGARGDVKPTGLLSGYAAYQHWWLSTLRSNAVMGFAHRGTAGDMLPADNNETMLSSQLNLIWSPRFDLTVGIEWLYGYRRQRDGRSGRLNRIQVSSIYKF